MEEVLIETCDLGHRFAKLKDHPRRDGLAQCPYCMSIGLAACRAELQGVRSHGIYTTELSAADTAGDVVVK